MATNNRLLTSKQIKDIGKTVVGKTFKELGDFKYNLEDTNYKGGMGILMEENVFEYNSNTDSNPDFMKAGIELKVTPIKKNKNGTYSAKERLVLNIINYMEEYKTTFETSSFWHKNKNLYLMFYLWKDGVPRSEYRIIKEMLFTFSDTDLIIIKQDWEYIINKIKEGKAHELSEADTYYLGACPKGRNKDSLRKQPFSEILAMQRAYCLKNSYMTTIVRKNVMDVKTESLIEKLEMEGITIETLLIKKVKPYIGLSVESLIKKFNLNTNAKNLNQILFSKMIGIEGKINETEEFLKANIVVKTVRIQQNDTIKESMSFPAFKFKEIVLEEWYTSKLRNIFLENKYLFVIFRELGNQYYFVGIKFWNMPLSILDNEVKEVWEKTVDVIKTGNIVQKDGAIRKTNFPGMKDNWVAHVRPHAQNINDTYDLPVRDKLTGVNKYTKHCFWLNNSFIAEIVNEDGDVYE